jgi:hypothetical protein
VNRDRDAALREAYRGPQKDEGDAPSPEHVLQYFPEAEPQRNSVAAIYGLLAPLFAFALVGVLSGSEWIGSAAGAAVVAVYLWRRRHQRRSPRATFTVDGSVLKLSGPAFRPSLTLELSQLLDVYLDTKTISRVQESAGPIPDLRFINATVGGEQDTARIALELEHDTLFLTEERSSHLDANEWFGKIRRFLRKHGWVPDDERQDQAGGGGGGIE